MRTTKTVRIMHYEDLMDLTEVQLIQTITELFNKVPDKYRGTAKLTEEPDPRCEGSYDRYICYDVPLTEEELKEGRQKVEDQKKSRKEWLTESLAALERE